MYKLDRAAIFAEVKRKVHESTLSDTQLELWSNLTQDYIWSQLDLKSGIIKKNFVTVEDVATYYIDCNIGRVLSIVNVTQEYPLTEESEKQLELTDPGGTTTGSPRVYSIEGKSETQYTLSAASKLSVTSTSALDTSQTVRITGTVDSIETTEEITLTGTTVATSTNKFDANSIKRVRISATALGNIALVDASSNSLVTIPIGKLLKQYQPITLSPTPSEDDDDIKVRCIEGPDPMISDSDTPDLPTEYHSLVLIGTLAQAHEELYEYDRASSLYDRLEARIKKLKQMDSSIRGHSRRIRTRSLRHSISHGRYLNTNDEDIY